MVGRKYLFNILCSFVSLNLFFKETRFVNFVTNPELSSSLWELSDTMRINFENWDMGVIISDKWSGDPTEALLLLRFVPGPKQSSVIERKPFFSQRSPRP